MYCRYAVPREACRRRRQAPGTSPEGSSHGQRGVPGGGEGAARRLRARGCVPCGGGTPASKQGHVGAALEIKEINNSGK